MILVDVILSPVCEDDRFRANGAIYRIRGDYFNKLFPPALKFLLQGLIKISHRNSHSASPQYPQLVSAVCQAAVHEISDLRAPPSPSW